MDIISFEKTIIKHPVAFGLVGARILINGECLQEKIENTQKRSYNYQFAESLYEYLTYGDIFVENDAAAVLTGACTVDECCGLYCKIEETDNEVIWKEFHEYAGTEIPLDEFRFDKEQYKKEVERLKNFV
ncbi:MAG: hypothetical protein FWH03_01985 [Firmicutes bacterium]|nr:hypothetical protein [Bacillota bacterium]